MCPDQALNHDLLVMGLRSTTDPLRLGANSIFINGETEVQQGPDIMETSTLISMHLSLLSFFSSSLEQGEPGLGRMSEYCRQRQLSSIPRASSLRLPLRLLYQEEREYNPGTGGVNLLPEECLGSFTLKFNYQGPRLLSF